MSSYRITEDHSEHCAEAELLQNALDDFCLDATEQRQFWPLTLCLRDAEGKLCGGLVGFVWGGWLEVKVLWLEQELRGTGYGSQLLLAAERYAYSRGARHAHLASFTFQAPSFYEKHGYEVFGELADYPAGHKNVFLRKALTAS
ncbi:MAG: GNAT family N-acetyltransferase [Myxococcales bacterium]